MSQINIQIKQQEERVVKNLAAFSLIRSSTLVSHFSNALKSYKSKYLLVLPLPKEVKKKHIKIKVKENKLFIKAKVSEGGIFRPLKINRSFYRSVLLPDNIEKKLVSYKLKKNTLFIRMPKAVLQEQLQDPFLYKLNLLIGRIKILLGF